MLGSHSLLITLFKSNTEDAVSQDNTFRKSLTTAKRIIALANNNLFAGFYVITLGRRIRPLFQPQRCTLTDADTGIEQEFLLGHSSNDPSFLRAEYTSVDVAKMLACIVNTDLGDIPGCFRSGPAFTRNDITATTTLTDILSPTASYKIVLLPTALPIPFGIGDTAKGAINDATADILDTTIPGGSFWAHQIAAYDPTQFDELMRLTNNDGLGKVSTRLIMPRLISGQAWSTSPLTRVFGVGDDEEDEANAAIDALTARLTEIKAHLSRSTETNSQAHHTRGPDSPSCFDDYQVATPIPRRQLPDASNTTNPNTAVKEVPLNDRLRDRARLAHLGWDRTAQSLHLPTFTENGEWIYNQPDRAGINENMANMFNNIPETLLSSTDFLHREVDLPHHDPLVYAQYATSYYEVATMMSIDLTGESKKRFRYFYLVPDSKSLAEEREHTAYDREAEELLGESKENLSKVRTTITTSTTINAVHHLRAYLANICAVIEAQFICDLTLLDIKTPAMFVVARTFALHITSASMRSYLKKTNQPHRPLVLWVVQMLDQLSILLTHPLRHTKNASLVAQGNIADIATDKFIEAFDLLDDCVSTLRKFESGTGTIPSCPLLQADDLKQAKSKQDKLKRTAPIETQSGQPSQKKARPVVATPSADDLCGTFIFKGRSDEMMPSVNEANPALRLCASRHRDGKHCPRGPSCKMIHDLDITKWPDTTFARWSALVEKTPTLEWNRRVVDPAKLSARSAKLASSALSLASTATRKS